MNTEIQSISLVPLFFIFYIIFSQIFKNPDLNTFFNVLFSYSFFFLILNTLNHINSKELLSYSKYFVLFSIILLFLESIWRFSHPVFQLNKFNDDSINNENILFYAFKYSSIMFKDSNFVANFILIVYFFYQYLLNEKLMKNIFPKYILLFFLILTLSRSAIITIPITYLLHYLFNKKNNIFLKIFFILLLSLFLLIIFKFESNDISFTSKFKIISLTNSYINKANFLQLLTGVGFGNATIYLGIGSHNLFITYFIECGILGLFFFLFINLFFLFKTNGKISYVLVPLFITGFSLSSHSIPYYFSIISIIYYINIYHGTYFSTNSSI